MHLKNLIPKLIFVALYQKDFRSTARILAKCIDLLALIFIQKTLNAFFGLEDWLFWTLFAPLIDLAYFHRSPGKCIFEFSNYSFNSKEKEGPFLFRQPPPLSSIYKRNFIWILWGVALKTNLNTNPLILGLLCLLIFAEISLVSWHPTHVRLGDMWANTYVKDLHHSHT